MGAAEGQGMRRRPRAPVGILLVCLPGLMAGCGVGDSMLPADFAACPAAPAPTPPPDGLTYYADAKPILDARCGSCHVEGGIAPFPLTTYAEVVDYALDIADVV